MNAIRDGLKEVNKKFDSLANRLTPLENKVKGLRMSVLGMSDTSSEQDGGGTPLDGGSKDASVLDIAKQIQSQHGEGDDDMDETAEMCAAAEKAESQMSEKAKSDVAKVGETEKESGDVQTEKEKKKKKRARKSDGKEVVPSKKAKDCDNVRSSIGTRRQKKEEEEAEKRTKTTQPSAGEKKQKKKAADEKEAAEKEAAQKKTGGKKPKKSKKGGKKTYIIS
ncbi:hypothetical protein Bca52824_016056 [Brassica carinata]|uniref:Uncharacterized protein n=1 Tax=Brassica carinata TaxID=52824 RepID=A0A8X7W6A6_BRACI|nr:hypothetical protein Bca52824_016056 [Brassica carinata]